MKTPLRKKSPERQEPPNEKKADWRPLDSICAIATPIGQGGIGIIRLSGSQAIPIAARTIQTRSKRSVEDASSHRLSCGVVRDPSTGEDLDEIMFAVMRAPKTYTGADTVELYCHGGPVLLHRILDLLIRQGARLAEPGEFTKWAFLNGRVDLTQAEAVMDLIHAKTEAGHRAAMAQMGGELHRRTDLLRGKALHLLAEIEAGIDLIEDNIQFLSSDQIRAQLMEIMAGMETLLKTALSGRALREGIATAIIGRPNVGKSSLLNALLVQNRAIVTPIPGTTRDTLEEYFNLDGTPVLLIDTAGLRDTDDIVEQEGVKRSRKAIETADLVIILMDASQLPGVDELKIFEETKQKQRVVVVNKTDLLTEEAENHLKHRLVENHGIAAVFVSALTGQGLDNLREVILKEIQSGLVTCGEREALINLRHKDLLSQAKESINLAISSLGGSVSGELIAMDVRAAIDRLGEITGATTTDDLLDKIFKEFCVGK